MIRIRPATARMGQSGVGNQGTIALTELTAETRMTRKKRAGQGSNGKIDGWREREKIEI